MSTLSSLLPEKQARQFQEDGYCIVDDLFSPQEIEEIEAYFENYKTQGYSTFEGQKIEDIDPKLRQLRAMFPHRHSEEALGWALNANVMAVLEDLLGQPPLLAQTMYYFKPPGACGQGMHQDDFYLLTHPHHCIAAWTAIDSADTENGCLYMVPGSQLGDMKCPAGATPENNFKAGVLSMAETTRKAIPAPVKRGQTVFFVGALIHGSSANRSATRSRRTFIGHYCDGVTDSIANFYHPVLNNKGNSVTRIDVAAGGGPCGDGWQGAQH